MSARSAPASHDLLVYEARCTLAEASRRARVEAIEDSRQKSIFRDAYAAAALEARYSPAEQDGVHASTIFERTLSLLFGSGLEPAERVLLIAKHEERVEKLKADSPDGLDATEVVSLLLSRALKNSVLLTERSCAPFLFSALMNTVEVVEAQYGLVGLASSLQAIRPYFAQLPKTTFALPLASYGATLTLPPPPPSAHFPDCLKEAVLQYLEQTDVASRALMRRLQNLARTSNSRDKQTYFETTNEYTLDAFDICDSYRGDRIGKPNRLVRQRYADMLKNAAETTRKTKDGDMRFLTVLPAVVALGPLFGIE